ncbi:MAG: ATP phosphoribosyltransferase [Candidatus Omnitrophica bacterium]|nr:ATP phosphoribosyltransferase [Candidatus Omnitrophota bacterium]MCF7891774.1 ATP phosphoribosyltransferase [Candidatus Omnitrophota bacterium]MCF7895552.1 ATP phosphoribosyltransferase [Candidatus Omnitrophota bacterium]MCF7897225.1 ATP phosphoribosyltransferase [Candidatus Omnitrophota bacterium]MCF7909811.1 ATP phosphoribosyltransferase [Candidatus Omnitrophota bacterium]
MKKVKIGIPKGSLQKKTIEVFAKAGFNIYANSRSYFPSIDDSQLQPVLVRAQDMSRYVEEGVLDCGITGEDWILENNSKVLRLSELMYAKRTSNPVRWVVAVSQDSKIKKINQLKGKRVATELVRYTKRFFKTKKINLEVEFSWGATEVKVKSGLVDAIVELTETGQSLRANGLKEIETICESVTKFIANKSSYKDEEKKKKIDDLLLLLEAALEARDKVGLKLNVREKDIDKIISLLPALKKPTISSLALKNWVACEVILEEKDVRKIIPLLKDNGAQGIIEYPLNKVLY